MKTVPKFLVAFLALIFLSCAGNFALMAFFGSRILDRIDWLETRVSTLEIKVGAPAGPAGEVRVSNQTAGDITLQTPRPETAADRILREKPETLSTAELAELTGLAVRTVTSHIIQDETGVWWVDRHGTRWRALKLGKGYRIQTPDYYLGAP